MPPPPSTVLSEKAVRLQWGGQFGQPSPNYNGLLLKWSRPFDCYCYILASNSIERDRYAAWLTKLTSTSSWSEVGLVAHGRKIHQLLSLMWEVIEIPSDGSLPLTLPPFALKP